MRAAIAALVLVLGLTGCAADNGAPTRSGQTPATSATPGTAATTDPQDLQELEDIVNGLDGVVGSAEAETAND